MISIASLLHARRRRAVADEGGFALIAVLAVIAFTGITIAALLGMMITTMRVTSSQERTARERRAADGAIENAIQALRTQEDGCRQDGTPVLAGQRFDQGTAGTGDDVIVDVDCSPDTPSATATNDQVQIVGRAGYDGAMAWTTDCATSAVEGCLPWAAAVGAVPSGLASSGVSMVHAGHDPLRFSTGVTVRRGAAALNTTVPAASASSAIELDGRYSQGDPGLLAATGNPCGMLSGTPNNSSLVDDDDGTPACDVQDARDVDPGAVDSIGPILPAPVLPSCSAGVVPFAPGDYDAALTAAVSAMTSGGDPACRGRTFHFAPGLYQFDGQLTFGDASSYYVFGAPIGWDAATGVQASALATTADGRLCNPAVSGASLVLSAQSSIEHTGGRVAICPAMSTAGTWWPAIYQTTSLPGSITIASPPATNVLLRCDAPVNGYDACLSTRQVAAGLVITSSGTVPIDSLAIAVSGREFGVDADGGFPNTRVRERQMQLTVLDPSDNPVCSTSFQSGLPNVELPTRYDLVEGGCSLLRGRPLSSLDQHRLRLTARATVDSNWMGLAASWGMGETRFGATDVTAIVNPHRGQASGGVTATQGSWANLSAAADASDGGQTADATLPCSGTMACNVNAPGRTSADMYRYGLRLGNFSFPSLAQVDPADAAVTSLKASLRIRTNGSGFNVPAWLVALHNGYASPDHYRPRMTTTVTLTTPSGTRCVVAGLANSTNEGVDGRQGGVNSNQTVSFDLGSRSGCAAVITTVSDLQNVSVDVDFAMPCVYINPGEACLRPPDAPPGGTWIMQPRPPSVDGLSLEVATDAYVGPTTVSSVRIDADPTADSSTFNVFGRALMSLTDLDLRWDGAASTTPLFADQLVLNGLGSRMLPSADMGTVCCSPPDSRTVELTASIGGADRVVARVNFDDVDRTVPTAPVRQVGHRVDVLRWLNCIGTCASVLSASDTNPNLPP